MGKASVEVASVTSDRLSLPFPIRVAYGMIGGFSTGLFLGLSHGSKTAGMRFRAENAHRFPTTQKGWYLYHKSKNYHMMLGGIKDSFKLAPKLGVWAGSFFILEGILDKARGQKAGRPGQEDFISTTIATLTLSGVWSLWSKYIVVMESSRQGRLTSHKDRLPIPTAVRIAKMGLYSGLGFGLLQDLAGLARGRRLAYVDFLMGRRLGVITDNEQIPSKPSHSGAS